MSLIIIKNKDNVVEEICECTYYSKAIILRNYMNNYILEVKDTPAFEKIQIPQSDLCTSSTIIKWIKEFVGKTVIILDCPKKDIWCNVIQKNIKLDLEPDENGNIDSDLIPLQKKLPINRNWAWNIETGKYEDPNISLLQELNKIKQEKIESGQKPFKPKKNNY